MRAFAILLLAAVLGACMPPVRVSTAAPLPPTAELEVNNSLQTAVNVYLVANGTEHLLGQVGSNSTRKLPIRHAPLGAEVTLRATRVDGSASYSRPSFVVEKESSWTVP
jgi:hypothetical protein